MRSFKRQPTNRRQVYLSLVGQIESQLRAAYVRRNQSGETQTDIARKLGVHRSTVNKRLTGQKNMTLDTVADMVWALGHCIQVSIFDPAETKTNQVIIVPDHRGVGKLKDNSISISDQHPPKTPEPLCDIRTLGLKRIGAA